MTPATNNIVILLVLYCSLSSAELDVEPDGTLNTRVHEGDDNGEKSFRCNHHA